MADCPECSRVMPMTKTRCSACRREKYRHAKYGAQCGCGRAGELGSNKRCRACNEEAGLRDCRKCNQLLLVELHFTDVRPRRVCDDCRIEQKAQLTRRKEDPIFRMIVNRRNRRTAVIKKLAIQKPAGARRGGFELDDDQLRAHIEGLFRDGMSWGNYGTVWHLDEIVPVSAWDLSRKDHWDACWHWSNCQPLLKGENLSKGDGRGKDYSEEIECLLKPKGAGRAR